jgi:SAM-dependent MidA family methyltransferase
LVSSLALSLQRGAIILIDYGFSAREYYHPQRNQGTLICHYQHHAHPDPLVNIGLQDITAHVDFSSVAYAGVNHGLSLAGFCSQAQFLMNAGMLELMAQVSPDDVSRYAPLAAAAQKLLSPAEMGDIFKVMALTKNLDTALIGFSQGDKSHTL